LAGGVAHDFNNLLTVILGSADLLLETLSADSPQREDLTDVRQAALRAAALTRQLLAFSRQQVLQPVVLNLNGVLEGTERMLRRLIGEDVVLTVRLDPELGSVKADPGQIEQIVINLAVNSRDAMPDGGQLIIETRNTEVDASHGAPNSADAPGRWVMLAVSDTGTGMDAATQARVFEPFFTTKEKGKGTGMGLATVYGIVKQSGGYIWLYSEPGQGTTFNVYLPRVDDPVEAQAPAFSPTSLTGTETVLLVEDDTAVGGVAQRILEGYGYTVLTASDGGEGLALAQRYDGDIHLLLSDIVLPTLSGPEVAQRLAERRPATRVLLMSGYTPEAVTRRGILEAGTALLQKPFTVQGLAAKVREVLDK
ncbi:MAG TPA: ATP-binding protein, partial [Gemmatimonadales bacterium]|nr:ATP-binding protein [Gemmatimonadales bacterium]